MLRHFLVCILPSERPRDRSLLGIAALLPGIDLGHECGSIRQASIQTLAIQDADFDFSHVEPARVFRGVVKDNATQQCSSFLDTEHVLKALAEMGIEVVHDQMDAACRDINLFEQMPDEGHEIGLGTAVGHHDGSLSALGFHRHEQIASAATDIFVILPHGRARLNRQWGARMLPQLLTLLVQADDRFLCPERTGVEVEQIAHSLPILLGQFADTPHYFAPRFEAVFLAVGGWSRD